MSTLELHPKIYKASDSTRFIHILREALIVLLAIIYCGLFPFLQIVSPYLLYALYPAILAPIVLCLYLDKQALSNLESVLPYVIWIIFYSLWGTLVSWDKGLVLPQVIRMVVQNILILSAIASALADRQYLVKFAKLIQVVVIINFIIQIRETADPKLIEVTARTIAFNATAFNELRPAGLWNNPNEATFALLFALLLSVWVRGPLAWIGRIAAIGGIYLTASRSGVYLLLLCSVGYLFYKLRSIRLTPGRLAMLCYGLAFVVCVGWMLSYRIGTLSTAASENWNIQRILDIQERTTSNISRVEVASLAAGYALDAPLYGNGIFTLQGLTNKASQTFRSVGDQGAHDIYIAVWGEIGIFGLFIYLLVLGLGLRRLYRTNLVAGERFTMTLMWIVYLLIGFVWHNQFTTVIGMIYVGLLYHIPRIGKPKALPYTGIPQIKADTRWH